MDSKNNEKYWETINRGYFEYKMTKDMMQNILKEKMKKNAKGTDQEYLCNYVNEQMGAKGNCIKVISF